MLLWIRWKNYIMRQYTKTEADAIKPLRLHSHGKRVRAGMGIVSVKKIKRNNSSSKRK
jgi:hypothetical protein